MGQETLAWRYMRACFLHRFTLGLVRVYNSAWSAFTFSVT